MSISTTIKTIQDIMRKDAGVDGDAQRISQLVWMIFLKIFDDREAEYELLEDNYRSPIPEALRWRNWATDPEGMTGDTLLDFVDNALFKTLKTLAVGADGDRRAFVVRAVFEDAYNYMKNGTLVRQVVNKLNEIDFNNSKDRHLFGDIYEQILRNLQSAGNAGEYYTPRAVTQFIVDMVDPQLGEKILDPACGTGGFLTCTLEHISQKYVKTPEDREKLHKLIMGVEKKPLPHLLCMTNMLLHGVDVPAIRHDNTLARPLRDYRPSDRVNVILTNPPFGGMEEDGIESNFPATYRTRETADLFLLLIMHLLEDGGRGAIVLPDGTLFGEGVKTRIKEKLTDFVSYATAAKCWQRCEPMHNDILMGCVGATIGRLCLIKEPPKFTMVRSVSLIRPFENYIYAEYMAVAIKSPLGQSQIWSKVKQSAQPCLYINKIQSLAIPIPPLPEQERIVAKVDQLMTLCDELEAKLTQSQTDSEKLMDAAVRQLLVV